MASKISKFIDYSPTHYTIGVRDFRCGNSTFSEDIWDFKGLVDGAETWHDYMFKFDFSTFVAPEIRDTIKWYILSELLTVEFSTVRSKFSAFNQLRSYLSQNLEIKSFKDFTKYRLKDFFEFVLTVVKKNGEPLGPGKKKQAAQVVQEILKRGNIKGWNVPSNSTYVQMLYESIILDNTKIKEGTKFGKTTDKVLPDEETVSKLIKFAFKNLDSKEDVLVAASIILSTQLGLRIEEVLTIKAGCLKPVDGEIYLTYRTKKTKKELIEVSKPANEKVCQAIRKLEEYTLPLRKESGLPYLFIRRLYNSEKRPPRLIRETHWNSGHLMPFIKRHDLRDSNGQLLEITSHHFRHICSTYARKKGMKTHDIAELLNHSSIIMTENYDHTVDKQQIVKEILSGETPITSTNKIILKSIEGDENPFKGKTIEQIDKIRRALKIEILPHGICTHHPMRGEPCEQDGACLGCGNFLASYKHLPVYEKRLEKVNEELRNANNDGIWESKLHYQQGKLEYYIKELSEKMANKNFQQAMSEVAVSKNDNQ